MNDIELNRRELTGDDALRFAREAGMERASETRGLFLASVGDLIRFARLVRAGWEPKRAAAALAGDGSRQNQGSSMDADRGGEPSAAEGEAAP